MKTLYSFSHIVMTTPLTLDYINTAGRLASGIFFHLKLLTSLLVNTSIVISIGYVLHPAALHQQFHNAVWRIGVNSTRTRISLKFLGQQKAIKGGRGTPSEVALIYDGYDDNVR